MADQVLGQFSSGMDRRSRRGGKNGPQQLWSLINGYIDAKKQVVPRPGLQHVADVANSAGLYGFSGQLHVFYGDPEDFVNPNNPLVNPHLIRYPLGDITIYGHLNGGLLGSSVSYTYAVDNAVGDFTVIVTSGSLPTGTSMDASGHVTGSFTEAAPDDSPFVWTIQVTDAAGSVATLSDTTAVSERNYHDTVISQGPVAYWRFNESSGSVIADDLGDFPGVYQTSGITKGTLSLLVGDPNHSVTGNGTGRVGDVADTLGVWQTEDISISCLFKPSSTAAAVTLVQQPDAPNYGTTLTMLVGGQMAISYTSQVGGTGTVVSQQISGSPLASGSTYHLAFTNGQINDTQALTRIFINGIVVGALVNDRRKAPTEELSTTIGAFDFSGLSQFLAGAEDELAVFPRALTIDEVMAQYEASI